MAWNIGDFWNSKKSKNSPSPKKKPVQLELEKLEDRWMPASFRFSDSVYYVDEGSSATITVIFEAEDLDYGSSEIGMTDGTATANVDYDASLKGVYFFDGVAGTFYDTFTIDAYSDDVYEDTETVILSLINFGGYEYPTLDDPYTAVLYINNVAPTEWAPEDITSPDIGAGAPLEVGPAGIDLQSGNVSISYPVEGEEDMECGCGSKTAQADADFAPVLVYNSNTANSRPIIQFSWDSEATDPVPTSVRALLTWNGSPQSWVTFDTTGHSAGDEFLMALQVSSAVTTTDLFSYTIELEANFSSDPTITRYIQGTVGVVANRSTFGYGWSIAGVDRLYSDTSGILYVSGDGRSRFFSHAGANGSGEIEYFSPSGDLGTLLKNTNGTYTYTTHNQVEYQFDTNGYLTTRETPSGLITTFAYSGGNISTITEPSGRVNTFLYSSGELTSIVTPGNRTTTLLRDGSDNITGITDPTGGLRSFAYNASHQVTSDRQGDTLVTFAYDATSDVATSASNDSGNWQVVPRLGLGLNTALLVSSDDVATVTNPNNHLSTFSLDAAGRTTRIVAPDGSDQEWTYNDDGQQTTFTDGNNNIGTYGYSDGNLVTSEDAQGNVYTYSYDPNFNKISVIQDPNDNRVTYSYNSSTGDLETVTQPDGTITTYAWSSGLLQSVTNQDGTITYTYTGSRDLYTVEDPFGNIATFGYDAAGNRQTVTDQYGTATTLYDGLNRITSVSTPGQGTATMAYNAAGLLASQTDPFGVRTDYAYDEAGRQIAVTRNAGTSSAVTATSLYDNAGNLTGSLDIYNKLTQYVYDSLDRVSVTIDPWNNRTTTLFDSNSNVTGSYDIYGQLTQYLYDSLNRVSVTIDTLNNRTSTLFDQAGNVTGSIDIYNKLTQYLFDDTGRQTVTIDPWNNRTTTLFDSNGRMTGSLDIYNKLTKYEYDAYGRQYVTEDTLGNRTTTLFASDGKVTGVQTVNGITGYEYDSLGRQYVTIDVASNRATTLFDTLGRVTGMINVLGNLTKYEFDSLNRQYVTIDALNYRTTTHFDSYGNVTGMQDARGNITAYEYDAYGRQYVTIDAASNRSTTLFNGYGNVTGMQDARGNLTAYEYDAYGRQHVTIDAASNRSTTLFNSYGNVTGMQDARGNITAYEYDAYGRQHVTIDAASNRTTTLFNGYGNVTGTQDALGRLTAYEYDAYGRQHVTVDAASGRSTTSFDGLGRVSAITDPLGNRLEYTYDSLDRQVTSTEAAGTSVARTVTMLYDAAGQMTGMINGRGYLTAYVYDAAGRQTVVVDALNHRTTSTLDGNGNVIQIEDAANRFTTMAYDSLNRQIEVIDATNSPSTTYYDAVGNVTGMRDGNNLLTQYQVDSLNRVTVTIDPRNYRTTTQFDAVGNITAITDASNNTSTFAYDSLNRKVTETDALGNSATFAYNAVGLLTSSTDRLGRRRDFGYDLLNRRTTEIWYSSGGSATETMIYSFDAGGNALTATDSDGTYTMTYNELNQVTQVEDLWGNILTFTYDDAGNRTIVEDSEGGVETSTYDAANNLTYREISGIGSAHIHIDIDYDNRNQIDQIQRYTGSTGPYTSLTTSDYSYDEKGRIENLAHDNGSVFANYTYTYDTGGRLTVEELNGTPTTYSYDNSNQLTDDGVNSLSFDGTGNRTNGSYATGTGNRITSDGTWTYSYDDEGNVTKKSQGTSSETWTYGYDHRNQMTLAQKWDKDPDLNGDETLLLEADYSYDVFGNRIEKNVDVDGDSTPDITVRYAYDGWKPGDGFIGNENWDVWGDFNSSDTLVDRYVRGDTIDQLFARIDDSGDPYWLLTDHLGSVRDVVDNTGTVVKTVAYDGYGNIISQSGTGSLGRYAWTGREIETETGLQYNRARYYNAAIGRWTSQDPLGFDAGDTNLYRYVNNAPTMRTDPSGLLPYWFDPHWQIEKARYYLDMVIDAYNEWYATYHDGMQAFSHSMIAASQLVSLGAFDGIKEKVIFEWIIQVNSKNNQEPWSGVSECLKDVYDHTVSHPDLKGKLPVTVRAHRLRANGGLDWDSLRRLTFGDNRPSLGTDDYGVKTYYINWAVPLKSSGKEIYLFTTYTSKNDRTDPRKGYSSCCHSLSAGLYDHAEPEKVYGKVDKNGRPDGNTGVKGPFNILGPQMTKYLRSEFSQIALSEVQKDDIISFWNSQNQLVHTAIVSN